MWLLWIAAAIVFILFVTIKEKDFGCLLGVIGFAAMIGLMCGFKMLPDIVQNVILIVIFGGALVVFIVYQINKHMIRKREERERKEEEEEKSERWWED